ncbi:MAG: amidohydrolase family protein [Devosia sp.]|nr:amidohydrolase family protein [Devosia sp.]
MRDAGGLYCGPVVDAHHHLWDLSLGRHPWLKPAAGGDSELAGDHIPADYARAAAGHNVVATVHVEAGWDADDPFGEIAWLDSLDKPHGIAARYVAHARLADPGVEAVLDRHASHPRIAGIREIVSWHPDPAKSASARNDRMDDPAWRRGLAALGRLGLSFDLLISPFQLADALRLAGDFPDIVFVLNHCGSPMDRDPDGMSRWRHGLKALAAAPNVALKISDLVAYDPSPTLATLGDVVRTCLDCFGTGRAMLASDHPVEALHASFRETYGAFKFILADLTDDESIALFSGNALRFYKF